MKTIKLKALSAAAGVVAVAGAMLFACTDGDAKPTEQNIGKFEAGNPPPPQIDGSTGDSGGDAGPKDCFDNPTTHEEILNACSSYEKVDKKSVLPLLPSDGKLPPLP